MTLTSTTTYNSFAGNGSTTIFSYTFRCYDESELVVKERVDATGVVTTKTLTTDYTVTEASDFDGGTVTMGTAPASGVTLYIISNADNTQETDLVASGAIAAETLETRLDRMQVQINEILAVLNRCLKVPDTENSITVEAENSVDRASNYLKYDASGNLTSSAT